MLSLQYLPEPGFDAPFPYDPFPSEYRGLDEEEEFFDDGDYEDDIELEDDDEDDDE